MSVTLRRHGAVGVLRFEREEKRNAFDARMTAAFDAALRELEEDPGLRVGVVTGGPSVFSAGTDIAEFDRAATRTPAGGEYGIARRDRDKPLVAAVEGPAVGGGVEIVLACDLVVAGRDATFSLPEVALGLVASCGALFRLQRAVPPMVAHELLLLGEPISADRAQAVGLVNRVVPTGRAVTVARELADRIAANAPIAVRETLRAMRATRGLDEARAWAVSDRAVDVVSTSEDAREGRAAFFEQRPPQWSGR